jgi:Uma2 family endonuclease
MDKEKNTPDLSKLSVKEAQVDYDRRYTYAEYVEWDDDMRWELIDGVPYMMSAPSRQHQELLSNLHVLFKTFLKGKSCKVYFAPFDVRLNADTFDNTVVQPDLLIVCDHSKLNKAGCAGSPDLVVEILSPSTSRYDRTLKFNTYLKSGIREYWVIDPETKTLAVHLLKDDNYVTHAYTDEDSVHVHVLESCVINMKEVFEE